VKSRHRALAGLAVIGHLGASDVEWVVDAEGLSARCGADGKRRIALRRRGGKTRAYLRP